MPGCPAPPHLIPRVPRPSPPLYSRVPRPLPTFVPQCTPSPADPCNPICSPLTSTLPRGPLPVPLSVLTPPPPPCAPPDSSGRGVEVRSHSVEGTEGTLPQGPGPDRRAAADHEQRGAPARAAPQEEAGAHAPARPAHRPGPTQRAEPQPAGAGDAGLGDPAPGGQAPHPPLEPQHRGAQAAGPAGRRAEPVRLGQRRGHPADGGTAGVGGRGQGRAHPAPAVSRVHPRLPRLPGPQLALLAQHDLGLGLQVPALLSSQPLGAP